MTIVEKEKCCACRACLQVCTKQAISIEIDKFGFERITIDENKCVNCNKCKSVCPILNNTKLKGRLSCGSAYSKNNKIKHSGSSGGLFGLMAKQIISNGGIVYGAAFDFKLHLKTTRAESVSELLPLYKSKYLLCDTTGAFAQIKDDLVKGKIVLYCSSPCQIAALKNYLHREYDNLICIDFVCHGVGSQRQFDDSVEYIEEKKNIRILRFSFREKYKKASSHYYCYYYRDLSSGKEKVHRDIYMTFPYYFAYSDRLTCRESCYTCKFASEGRVGDITIGDFHSIAKYQPEIDRFAGVSMFVCNTEKGKQLLDSIANEMVIKNYEWEIIRENNRFSGVETPPKSFQAYMNDYATITYKDLVSKYFNYRLDWRYYYYHLPESIRKIGNKILRRE